MIICDKCKKEIKVGESYTQILVNDEQKHYCKKCSGWDKQGKWWIIVGITIFSLVILLLILIPSVVRD